MLLFYLALAAAILAGVAGQLLLKAGADAETVWAQLLRPSTIVGLGFYGCGAFLYLIALRKIPVSVAFPSVAASYAVVAFLGYFLWNEPLGLPQVGGLVLIICGVLLLQHY